MLERLGRFTVRRRKAILVVSVLFLVASGVFGGGVVDRLTSGGFEDPDSESVQARELLENQFNAGDPNLVMLVTAKDGSVDDKAVAAAGLELTGRLAKEENVQQVVSYWSLGSPPPLASTDGSKPSFSAGSPPPTPQTNEPRISRMTASPRSATNTPRTVR